MKIGTSHFRSLKDAVKYYRQYGCTGHDVNRKVKRKDISIGPPKTRPGESLVLNEEGRYFLEIV